MAVTPVYIIDTSSLTQAYRTYYSFDITPSFWAFLKQEFSTGRLISNDKVYDEIMWGSDDLATWLKSEISKTSFIDTKNEAAILTHYAAIMNWSSAHVSYNQNAKNQFADFDNADPWTIACALDKKLTVVSQEVSAPLAQRAIKIPDVCNSFNIRHIDTFGFLREVGFKM